MRTCRAAASVFVLLVTTAVQAQQPVFTPPALLPPLETYLESLRQQAGIPGMSSAVVQDGQVVWEYGFGFQNLGSRVRATPDTPYQIGDASSAFGAVLLLQCVEQHRLELDASLRTYGLSLAEEKATLRQVLSHSSEAAGGAFSYGPDRFAQLTDVMEWCAPQPYRKSIAHRLLNRLAMRDSVPGTNFSSDADIDSGLFTREEVERYRAQLRKAATPYKVDARGRAEPADLAPIGINAATGLVTTVRDLAHFDQALDSSLLLGDDMLATAWAPVTTPAGAVLPTGLGWFVQTYRGERLVWTFGYVPGAYSSLILKVPARRITFVLLANSDGLSAPFQLANGDVTRSPFAMLFLRYLRLTP